MSTFLPLADGAVSAPLISPAVPGTLVLVLIGTFMVVARIIKTVAGAAKAILGPLLTAMAVLALIALVLVVTMVGNSGASQQHDKGVANAVSPAVVMGG